MELIVIWACFGIGAVIVASNRGDSGCTAFLWGVLLGPIGLLIVILSGGRRCPHCKSKIHQQATICPMCQQPVPLEDNSPRAKFEEEHGEEITTRLARLRRQEEALRGQQQIRSRLPTWWWLIIPVLIFVFGLYLRERDSSPDSEPWDSWIKEWDPGVEITEWDWEKNPDWGKAGAVMWNVKVHNPSSRHVHSAWVMLSTFDSAGTRVSTDHTYVMGIPPGETRASKARAGYSGTESSAKVEILEVSFAK